MFTLFPKALNNFLKKNIFVDASYKAVFFWNGHYKYRWVNIFREEWDIVLATLSK